MTVGYQGVPGAYSSIAAHEVFPRLSSRGFTTFDEVVGALRGRAIEYAVLPIENSTSGRVADIHHLLASGDISIIGEHFLPIHHCLIGLKDARTEDIRHVYSHREALNQCRDYIRSLRATPVPFTDTAASVDHVSELKDPRNAALASSLAVKRRKGMVILEHNVEDRHDNVTRFLVMSRRTTKTSPLRGQLISSIVFATRDIPAALFKSLAGFATTGTNIIKLESFVPMSSHQDATFYLEFEGSPADAGAMIALDDLRHYAHDVVVLGSYPKSPYRKHFERKVDKKRYSPRNSGLR